MGGQRETLDLDPNAGSAAFSDDDREPEIHADCSKADSRTIRELRTELRKEL